MTARQKVQSARFPARDPGAHQDVVDTRQHRPVNRGQGGVTSVAADFHIAELVDDKVGVYGMIPKSIFLDAHRGADQR